MTDWIHAEYRDFRDVPRMMVCTDAHGTYLFWSRFNDEKNDYSDYYETYRIRPLSDSEACASWFGLETRALERLPDIPVGDFPFDVARRRFLPYDPIAPLLKTTTNR
jgi:hypothetical protein